MRSSSSIVWLRSDLRLADNPALHAAVERGKPIIPLFIWAPAEEGEWRLGAASCWWLHHSLADLDRELRGLGSRLVVRSGQSFEILRDIARLTGASAIFWNRRYEPACVARDRQVAAQLDATGLHNVSLNASLLFEPWTVSTKSRAPFQVFTPFWRTCLASLSPTAPMGAPRRLPAPIRWPHSMAIHELGLLPKGDWTNGLRSAWKPGAHGAREQLDRFLAQAFAAYTTDRNRPDKPGTSRLSPYLHFGEIGPRQVVQAMRDHAAKRGLEEKAWKNSHFFAELGWREFAHHLIYHFPNTTSEPLRSGFAKFPWRSHDGWLRAWQRGKTGYPLVDAGMRELWTTGWMHNRVRMVVASFLVKDLMISWRRGAEWFWDTLVDADLANNTLGWQWTAGCGADAAPFFRVFNPSTQGAKFDPEGDYVRKWVPELGRLTPRWIHRPWEGPEAELAAAGIGLDQDYPRPIVQHGIARAVALEAYAALKAI